MIRRISVVAALTAALVMSGCGGDAPSGEPSGTPTSAPPSPTATAAGPVAPVLPEAAKVNTAAGAEAFLTYWIDSVTYGMHTGDATPMVDVSGVECKTCENLRKSFSAIYSNGGRLDGGGWSVVGAEVDPHTKPPYYRLAVRIRQLPQRELDGSGRVVAEDTERTALFYAGVEWREGFEFLGLERIDD